jgi:2OG-Fe(II) oxygenase superfamily
LVAADLFWPNRYVVSGYSSLRPGGIFVDTPNDTQIKVPYNRDLKALEDVLAAVRRPGDFFVHGSLETPMPRVEIDGVGVISFPILDSQIQDIIKHAERAPYGRGGETILDTSVRNTWQLAPVKVRIGGKSWGPSFQHILSTVADGLGCTGTDISAEFYKLLVYEEGGFFLPHRDTEKTDGMFGTLTIVLPSVHCGGELVIRHAGREVTVDLSNPETSELTFAAFYADCEHAIKPITQGSRVCLTYNLLQRRTGEKNKPITAPLYDSEADRAEAILEQTFKKSDAPAKLAWLLEHQYSPVGLSFSGLKGRDAALAKVARHAARRAECALHLGIVHIEESGAAEPCFDVDYGRARRRGGYYDGDDMVEDADTGDEEFEVIEVFDTSLHIDQWIDTNDHAVEFGSLPMEDGEILPAGALDGKAPDQQRLTEATGNEGASFERSYHRAALVIWPQDRFVDVLLQAGPGAALPYFKDRVQALNSLSVPAADQQTAHFIAERIIAVWEATAKGGYRGRGKESDLSDMIALLGQLADAPLLDRFIAGVVTREYSGSENEAMAANVQWLGPIQAGQLLSHLAIENMRFFPAECVNLLSQLTPDLGLEPTADWIAALREIGAAIVGALPDLTQRKPNQPDREWWRTQKAKPVDGATVADLLETLAALNASALRDAACKSIAANPKMFDPAKLIVPALQLLRERNSDALLSDREVQRLWCHSAEFLLVRSEQPPESPTDWRQDVKIVCRCDDCGELQAFAFDPTTQTHRFQVRKERRQHLHQQIDRHRLDMTHVTVRTGSPQTLVCSKTRATYERQCRQYNEDLASMAALCPLIGETDGDVQNLRARMNAARQRRSLARSAAT